MSPLRQSGLIVGIIGKDGRTSAIKQYLRYSDRVSAVVSLSSGKEGSREHLLRAVSSAVEKYHPDFVVIGPEEPLAHGVVDHLSSKHQVPCIGPTERLAKLESSKAFTRDLITRHQIPGNPRHRIFDSIDGIGEFLYELGEFVVKPDGLTGGKGVKVSGDHLHSVVDALEYCDELFSVPNTKVVIEEKLDGEEFSLQSFCDGSHLLHMPIVQDHKRAYDGDTGPNTGGMGSYSCADHSLPFLDADAVARAQDINTLVANALYKDTREKYKGVLFGGFMLTKDGVRLLEYNARFGDPEALNVLSLLEPRSSLLDICEGILTKRSTR
jgi:phosphoribosylamine--glycine ligase